MTVAVLLALAPAVQAVASCCPPTAQRHATMTTPADTDMPCHEGMAAAPVEHHADASAVSSPTNATADGCAHMMNCCQFAAGLLPPRIDGARPVLDAAPQQTGTPARRDGFPATLLRPPSIG